MAHGTEQELVLINEAKNGGDFALAQLLRQHYNAVYRYLCGLTLDPQVAGDVTQDCMERVIEKLALYDPEKSAFETWVIAIAKNLWIEECRRGGRRRRLFERYAETLAPEESSRSTVEEAEQKDTLLTAVRRLDPRQRVPVLMKHTGGYSYEEIAHALKIPVGTVKSRIANGIKALKKELERDDRTGD